MLDLRIKHGFHTEIQTEGTKMCCVKTVKLHWCEYMIISSILHVLQHALTKNSICCSSVCSSWWLGVGPRPGRGVTRTPDSSSSSPGVFSHLDGASSNTRHGVSPTAWKGQGQTVSQFLYIYKAMIQAVPLKGSAFCLANVTEKKGSEWKLQPPTVGQRLARRPPT